MYLTLEEYAAAWEKMGSHGTKEERIERNASWIPFYTYVAQVLLRRSFSGRHAGSKVQQTTGTGTSVEYIY